MNIGRWRKGLESLNEDLDTGFAYIQVLSGGGGWFTYGQCLKSDPGVIDIQLQQAKNSFPDRRVRAVDHRGQILDIQ